MSQTRGAGDPSTLSFDAQSYRLYARRFRGEFVTLGLLGSLYGVLAILSLISTYALTQRLGNGRMHPTAIILSSTIFALFVSTTAYLVTCILYYQSDFLDSFLFSPNLLWATNTLVDAIPDDIVQEDKSGLMMKATTQACASTTTLTINVILGDAIVCWRACVVWHKNRLVQALCGILLLATFVLGVIDTTRSCHPSDSSEAIDNPFIFPGTLFEGLKVGIAACILSLCTNLFATLLVAYKAWESRRRLRGYLVAKVGGSQVEKIFALLIESGVIYSAIWVVIVAFQFYQYKYSHTFSTISTTEYGFMDTFGAIMSGALVPVIAIYPTIIILLVALNRSHVEKGLRENTPSVLTPRTISGGYTQSRSRSSRRLDVLVIDRQSSEDGTEDTRMVAREEWKMKDIADSEGSIERLLVSRV